MKKCTRCGTKISDKTTLCPACGTNLNLAKDTIKNDGKKPSEKEIDCPISISDPITDDTKAHKNESNGDLDCFTESYNAESCEHQFKPKEGSTVIDDITERNEKISQLILSIKIDATLYESELDIIEKQKTTNTQSQISTREIIISIIAFLLPFIVIFGYNHYKKIQLKAKHRIHYYGGTKPYAEKSVADYNERIVELDKIMSQIIYENPYVYIYTNDTNISHAILHPNIDYDTFIFQGINDGLIKRNENKIRILDSFLKNKDELGFIITLKTNDKKVRIEKPESAISSVKLFQHDDSQLPMKILTNADSSLNFVLKTFHLYSSEEKEYLRENMPNSSTTTMALSLKHQQLEELEGIQTTFTILSEEELENQKIEAGLRAIFAPIKGSIDHTHTFYFTTYNKEIPENEFKTKVHQFVSMFLKNNDTTGCSLQKVKLELSDKLETQELKIDF